MKNKITKGIKYVEGTNILKIGPVLIILGWVK